MLKNFITYVRELIVRKRSINKVLKVISVWCILSALLCACMHSSSYRDGIDSFEHQDYRKAFIRLKPWAVKGNKDAQYAIGYMYYYGEGVVEDKKEAMTWIIRAANQGQEQAITALKIIRN